MTAANCFSSVAYANPRIVEDLGQRIAVGNVAQCGRRIIVGGVAGVWRIHDWITIRRREDDWVTSILGHGRLWQLAPILK